MKTQLFVIALALLAALPLQAQREEITPALQSFLQTNFMRQYQDIRIKAEGQVRSFTQQAGQLPPQDVARVQIAYDQTAQRFNQLLETVKQDFMDSGKLKYITRYPDSYSAGLELEIRKLSDFYSQNFQQALADVTGNQMDGSPLLLLLFDLVKFTGGAVSHFVKIRREARMYNETYLNRYFIAPNRFKTWQELTMGGFGDPYANPNTFPNTNDPFAVPSSPYGDPYGNPTNNPYGNPTTDPYGNPTNNPYGNPTTDPYGNPTNNPYGNPSTDPYGNPTTDPYGNPTNNPNNNPFGNPSNDLYGQQNGINAFAPKTVTPQQKTGQSDAIWLNPEQPQQQPASLTESTFGSKKPAVDSTKIPNTPKTQVKAKKGNQ